MKIFLHSDDPAAAVEWFTCGVPDGLVTTTPAAGSAGLDRIVDTSTDVVVLVESDDWRSTGPWPADAGPDKRFVLDLPIADPAGGHRLADVHGAHTGGRTVSVRGCLAVGQVLLGWRAGASYARLDWSSIVADGGDPFRVVAGCVQWGGLRRPGQHLLIDAVRTVGDFYDALRTSADGIVVTADVLHGLTRYAAARGVRP